MRETIKVVILVFGAFLLGSCQRGVDVPVQISAPSNATGTRVNVSPDNSSHEFMFLVSSAQDDYSVVDQIESQLTKAGFARCAGGNGRWETLRRHQDGRVVEENRLLRFFRTSGPRQLGMILVRQHCNENQAQCEHQFLVRQIDMPESIPDGDRYLREICENRSQIVDPGAKLQFP